MTRKRLISFLIGFICLFLVGCNPHHDDSREILYIGDSYTINEYISGVGYADLVTILYDDCYAEELDEDYVLIVETVTIIPGTSLQLTQDNFVLGVGYESYDSNHPRRKSSIKYNIERNQYDIFSKEITDSTTYHFCFIIPIQHDSCRYDEIGIQLIVFNRIRLSVTRINEPRTSSASN